MNLKNKWGSDMICKWEDLPQNMQNEYVRKYYECLQRKQLSLLSKRIFDVILAFIIIVLLLPVFVVVAISIKLDSEGPILFNQIRITKYGKTFEIFKFRTMVNNAEDIGPQVTTKNDSRVTRIGNILRKFRIDEIPQLFNILSGDMSFVGTRPEVVKYVARYSQEMMATLLLPAGLTSEASIHYKDEEQLLSACTNVDEVYINQILVEKMKFNLKSIEEFSIINEFKTILRTGLVVMGLHEIPDLINRKI